MMISYDNYVNKIQKVAKFKNFVHKFRFLFIGIFSLIIAATSGLLIAKGEVTTAMTLLTEGPIYFGDQYAFSEASAFLSSVSYEFSAAGTDVWTSEKPVKAGKYLARTVTDKAVGKGYGTPIQFEILPRPVAFTIGANSVVYGDVPSGCAVSGLVSSDHKLVTDALQFEYESYTATRTQVDVIPSSVKITNGRGEDYTSCYDITCIGKELDITPRAITLRPKGFEHTYSGSEVSALNELTEGAASQLAYGDTITIQTDFKSGVAPKNVGSYEIEITGITIMHGQEEVTHQYDAKNLTAWLTINARKITVTTDGATKDEYDGAYIQNTNAPKAEGLVAGHKISVPEGFDYPKRKDAGSTQNIILFGIWDGDENVTSNYDIEYGWGVLTVGRRRITITTGTQSRDYNGAPLFDDSYEVRHTTGAGKAALADCDKLELAGGPVSITNVWESTLNGVQGVLPNANRYIVTDKESGSAYNENGFYITDNYEIQYIDGTLTIRRINAAITTKTDEKEYDGSPLKSEVVEKTGILEGQEVYTRNVFSVTDVLKSGRDTTDYRIRIISTGEDVTENYILAVTHGTLTVTPRPIVVTTGTRPFVFDGEGHSYDGYVTGYDGIYGWTDGLVTEAHRSYLTISDLTVITDVGTKDNVFKIVDTSGNYQIRIVPGKLTVTPRPIKFITTTDWKFYDGTPLKNETARTHLDGNENAFGLLERDKDKLVLSFTHSGITSAGWIRNECTYTLLSDNYEVVDYDFGILTVDPRPITVQLRSLTFTYGDDNIAYPSGLGNIANLSACDLAPGEQIRVTVAFYQYGALVLQPKDVGAYEIRFVGLNIFDKNGEPIENGSNNYSWSYPESTWLTIDPKPVTVTIDDSEYTYGDPAPAITYTPEGLVFGEELTLTFRYEQEGRPVTPKNAGEYTILDDTVLIDGSAYGVGNYSISYIYGTLTIKRRPITVVIGDQSKTYDCEPYYFAYAPDNYKNFDICDLAGGETLQIAYYYTTDQAGEHTIAFSARFNAGTYYIKLDTANCIIYQNGIAVEGGIENYAVTCDGSVLTIEKLKVTITQNDISSVTYGEYASYQGFYSSPEAWELPFYNGVQDTISLDYYLEKDGERFTCADNLRAGTYLVRTDETSVRVTAGWWEDAEDVTGNYDFTDYIDGTLEVQRRAITVTIKGFASTYGENHAYPYAGADSYYAESPSGDALVFDDTLEVFVKVDADRKTPVGQYDCITLDYFTVNGVIDDDADYEFLDFVPGRLFIEPKEIDLTVKDLPDVTYGNPVNYPAEKGNYGDAELANSEEMQIGVYFTEQSGRRIELWEVWNVGTYLIKLDRAATVVYDEDGEPIENGLDNYKIVNLKDGSVKVVKKPVTLVFESDLKVIYGEAFDPVPALAFDPVEGRGPGELPYGEVFDFIFRYQWEKDLATWLAHPKHVGQYVIEIDKALSTVQGGGYSLDNYTFDYEDATVAVTERPITLELCDILGIEYGEDYDVYPVNEEKNYKDIGGMGLADGDRLTVTEVKVTPPKALPDVGLYERVVTLVSAAITSGDGYITDYAITPAKGNLEIVKRQIIVVTNDAKKVYDGTALYDEGYKSHHVSDVEKPGLLNGDTLTITDHTSIINVADGPADNILEYEEMSNYDITLAPGTLEILKRQIYIASMDGEDNWIYDGEAHSTPKIDEEESYYLDEEGNRATPAIPTLFKFVVTDFTEITDAGTVDNELEAKLIFADGESDVDAGNYEIRMRTDKVGKLTVLPKHITVITATDKKPYDGTALSNEDYDIYKYIDDARESYDEEPLFGLVSGNTLYLANADGKPASITNAWEGDEGVIPNANDYESSLGGNGEPNYIVHVIYGTLTIEKVDVRITIDDKTIEFGDEGEPVITYQLADGYSFASGESLRIAVYYEKDGTVYPFAKGLDAGDYTIVFDEENSCILDAYGKEIARGIENYNIGCEGEATLTVNVKEITVTLNDFSVIYGDQLIDNEGYNGFTTDPDLGEGDTLTFEYGYFCEKDGELVSVSSLAKISAGTYYVCAVEDTELVNGAKPRNYKFTFEKGTVTVDPREVAITLNSHSGIDYGDDYLYPYTGAGNYAGAVGPDGAVGLVNGDTLEVFVRYLRGGTFYDPADHPNTKLSVGDYDVVIYSFKLNGELYVYDETDFDGMDYIFTFTDGKLTIDKREISFRLATVADATYGTVREWYTGADTYIADELNMAYGEHLEVAAAFYYWNGAAWLWTAEAKDAHSYQVRFLSISVYADEGYGQLIPGGNANYKWATPDPVEFTISPKAVTVTIGDSGYVYGETPATIGYSATGLEFTETLTLIGFLYNGNSYIAPTNAGEHTVTSEKALVRINGSTSGVDNYTYDFGDGAKLNIAKRHIRIVTASDHFTYDGQYHGNNTFTDTPLNGTGAGFIGGDKPTVSMDSVPKVKNVSEGKVQNIFLVPENANYIYEYDYSASYIWIDARDLTVTLADVTIIYGEELPEVGFTQSGLVTAAGDAITISAYIDLTQAIPDVGTYYNAVKATVTFTAGEATNYDVDTVEGTLTVMVRRIVITTESNEWTYDGESHSHPYGDPEKSYYINLKNEHIIPALVEGHAFEAGDYPEITDVGTVLNTCYGGDIYDKATGKSVLRNYEIDYSGSGTLTILPRPITVKTGSAGKPYDGTALSSDTIEITEGTIADNQSYKLTYLHEIVNVDESKAQNNVSKITVYDKNNRAVKEDNYTITYANGTLTITPRAIKLVTATDEWAYDGRTHRNTADYQTYLVGNPEERGLVGSDTLSVRKSAAIIDVGEIENECEYYDTHGNYSITYEYGTLTVNKRRIIVVTNTQSKYYDGEELFNTGYTTKYYLPGGDHNYSKAGLIGSDKLTLDETSIVSILNVSDCKDGPVSNTLSFTLTSDNYEIYDYEYGTLEITPRPLLVETETDSKPYDGTKLENPNYKTSLYDTKGGEGLLNGEELTLLTSASIKEVGSIDNKCTYSVPNDNYNIATYKYGTLTVTRADLVIVLNEVEDVPYGKTFTYPTENGGYQRVYRVIGDDEFEGLFDGETLTVAVYYSTDAEGENKVDYPVNVGKYYVHVDLARSTVLGTDNGLDNYHVIYEPGIAEITRLTLKIELIDAEYEYQGTAPGFDGSLNIGFRLLEGEFVRGEFLTVGVKYFDEDGNPLSAAPVNVGVYKIKLDPDKCLINGGTMKVDDNYILEYEDKYYSYEITPATLIVTLNDVLHTYGDSYDFERLGGITVTGLKGRDTLPYSLTYDGSDEVPAGKGTYAVAFVKPETLLNYVIDDENSTFTCTLTVNARNIRVTVKDREVEYSTASADGEAYTVTLLDEAGWPRSGAGFVGDDESYVTATYYYDDSTQFPTTVGIYTVTVVLTFSDSTVAANYQIEYRAGTLEITGRHVLVTPTFDNSEDIVYKGEPVTDEVKEKLGFEHIHLQDGAPDGEQGFDDLDLPDLTVTYTFTGNGSSFRLVYMYQDGEFRYVGGDAPTNAGTYTITVAISGYEAEEYKVDVAGRAANSLVIKQKTVLISSITNAQPTKEYDRQAFRNSNITITCAEGYGLAGADLAKGVTLVPLYIGKTSAVSSDSAVNVDTYEIRVQISDRTLAGNYTLQYDCNFGSLEITPIVLYIRPIDKKDYYNGHDLELEYWEYEFLDEAHGAPKLLPGDVIHITPSTKLDRSRLYATVTIRDYAVFDASGVNVTKNYKIYFSYDSKEMAGTNYSTSTFKGSLEFLVRTVTYNQIAPQREVDYDGTQKTVSGDHVFEIKSVLGVDGIERVYSIAEGVHCYYITEGAFEYRIEVRFVAFGPQTGDYTTWMALNVYEGTGYTDISELFYLKLERDDDAYVTIAKHNITLTIKASLTSDMLGDRTVFPASPMFDGRSVLDPNYYEIGELMESSHESEVLAVKSRGEWYFIVVIYEIRASGSRLDKSDCYNLEKVIYENEAGKLDVKDYLIVDINSLTSIPSDITLTVETSYQAIKEAYEAYEAGAQPGDGFEVTFDNRLALTLYRLDGLLLEEHTSQVIVLRSNGVITLAVLVFKAKLTNNVLSGRNDRSEYYYLMYTLPDDASPANLKIILTAADLGDVRQDVTITFEGLPALSENGALVYFEGRWVIDTKYFKVRGLLTTAHAVQIIPVMSNGRLVLAVMIYELKSSGSRSDRSYLYNLVIEGYPGGEPEKQFISSVKSDEVPADIRITLKGVTAADIMNGIGIEKSAVDGRWILSGDKYEIEEPFGKSPFVDANHEVEIIVDRTAGNVTLYVIVYQLSSSGKRGGRTYLYHVTCEGALGDIGVQIRAIEDAPLGNEGQI